MMRPADEMDLFRWLPALNNSGAAEIPAFGLCRPVSADSSGVITVDAPNTASQFVFVNGPSPIDESGYGAVTMDHPVFALYDTGDGSPALGESWGAGASGYKLRKNNLGFIIIGGATDGRVLVRRGVAVVTDVTCEYDSIVVTTSDAV